MTKSNHQDICVVNFTTHSKTRRKNYCNPTINLKTSISVHKRIKQHLYTLGKHKMIVIFIKLVVKSDSIILKINCH